VPFVVDTVTIKFLINKTVSKLFTPEQLESFKWRIWNGFKSFVLPVVVGIILLDLQSTPDDLSGLLHGHLWVKVGYAVLITVLGSLSLGTDKVLRMKTEVNIEKERVEDLK